MMPISRSFRYGAVVGLLASPLIPHTSSVSASQRPVPSAPAKSAQPARFTVPPRFEPNKGQADANVMFVSRGPGYTLSLTATEAVVTMPHDNREGEPIAIKMTLAGGESRAAHRR